VNVFIVLVGARQQRIAAEVGQQAQLDLRIIRREQLRSRRGGEGARISRPSSVRVGMFCRFGLIEESRPVATAAA